MQERFVPKAICFDYDGTLLETKYMRKKVMPSERVVSAIARVSEVYTTNMLTARPINMIPDGMLQILNGYASASNGAELYNLQEKKYEYQNMIDTEILFFIIDTLMKENITFWVQDNGIDYVLKQSGDLVKGDAQKEGNYVPNKPFVIVAHAVNAVILEKIHALPLLQYGLIAYIANDFKDGTFDVFIADKKTNKRHGLLSIAKIVNVDPIDILVFADGANDRVFMELCHGVAVSNADELIKNIAWRVTESVENNGVAVVLEELLEFGYISRN